MNYSMRCASVLALMVLYTGCRDHRRGETSSAQTGTVEDTLHHYLVREARETYGATTIERDRIITESRESAVVPGLRLHYAEYRPRERPHLLIGVTVGERNGQIRVIRDQRDYGVLSEGWLPGTAAEAMTACEEAITTSVQGREHHGRFVFTARDSAHPAFLAEEWARIATYASGPVVRQVPGGWEVDLWALQSRQPRGAVHYRCLLLRAGRESPLQVTVADSVVFPEIPR